MDKYYIGIDLGGTNIKGSIFNNDFSKIEEQRFSTGADKGSEYVLNRINRLIITMLNNTALKNEDMACIGIGVPGLLNINEGISLFSPNFSEWENVPVVKWLEEKLHIPVFIDNDVRVNLYGEWYFGVGQGFRNVVLLTIGTGLGSGIVIDGHVLYGSTGSVGEIGHMNMYREGRPCKCGSSGCLGRYVSALGLIRTLKEKIECGHDSIIFEWVHGNLSEITAKMISKAYDLDDKVAIETMHETGEMLGFGLVNVINLYNPEIIIIGGGMASAGERFLKETRKIVNNHALKIPNEKCTITTAVLGDTSGMIGAAIYAKQKLEIMLS